MSLKSRVYYVNPQVIVLGDPYNGNLPVVLLRHLGVPSREEWKLIDRILKLCQMEPVGEPGFRPNGFWFCHLKEKEGGEWSA